MMQSPSRITHELFTILSYVVNTSQATDPDILDAFVCTARARAQGSLRVAVVDPTDELSLGGALAAQNAGLIEPLFVGDRDAIRTAAEHGGHVIDPTRIHHTALGDAARAASDLAADGEVHALMKGAIHSDTLLHAVISEPRLQTRRRISHVMVLDVPKLKRPLLLTDAAVNIAPDLDAKRDITQNAIELAQALGIARPLAAILSAAESVSQRQQSTLDAAALSKMAQRGQILGGIVDGPLALDDAVSPEAARAKNIDSSVAGYADILVAPDIDAGNMIFKTLDWLAGARFGGLVCGARVPIILTGRSDHIEARVISCALAVLVAALR
jgi:phosphotransacetylase